MAVGLPSVLLLLAANVVVAKSNTGLFGIRRNHPLPSSKIFQHDNPLLRLDNANFHSSPLLLSTTSILRGGALTDDESDYSDEESEEEESDYDEELFGLDEEDFETAEDEFAEDNAVERMMDAWKKTPPLTKSYLSASFAATAYGYALNKNEFPSILSLEWQPVLKRMQLWRPLTAFLNFGPLGLGYLMTAHFVWTYMSTLERLHHSKPYDFWIMILFGQLCMVVGYPIFKLSPKFLGHNLSTFLVYIWSRFHEGMEVNMFELFNSRAELLPWFFLAQVCIMFVDIVFVCVCNCACLPVVWNTSWQWLRSLNITRTPDVTLLLTFCFFIIYSILPL